MIAAAAERTRSDTLCWARRGYRASAEGTYARAERGWPPQLARLTNGANTRIAPMRLWGPPLAWQRAHMGKAPRPRSITPSITGRAALSRAS